ncbi:hypothetical protein FBEOM_3660 [Fusarium beomiforme]|uniref:Uncharacterized protein n=1 Tax=Fusarium beomiforme TaxID=44412 RepID=A0A9P5APQ4_9HYPO|nr:hypothetical protein FBEOM_3660 [Fusarium beomiforme]
MHSTIFALVAVAGYVSAGPTARSEECQGVGQFYTCANNGFRGYCSVDPCAIKWCTDFVEGTCDPVFITKPVGTETEEEEEHWEPETTPASLPEGQCAPGTGFFQVCSNGFKGCCKSDACSQTQPICPDTIAKRSDDPTVCAPGTGFFQSCSNGFRGCCKSDACSGSAPICPDTVAKRSDDPTVCPPGTGFFQSCSNGFRGCCKGDACGNSWCPDYKTGTYEPAQTFQVKARADGTCRPGTGFFQVCANGFKGCCKKDACSQKKPVCPK